MLFRIKGREIDVGLRFKVSLEEVLMKSNYWWLVRVTRVG